MCTCRADFAKLCACCKVGGIGEEVRPLDPISCFEGPFFAFPSPYLVPVLICPYLLPSNVFNYLPLTLYKVMFYGSLFSEMLAVI